MELEPLQRLFLLLTELRNVLTIMNTHLIRPRTKMIRCFLIAFIPVCVYNISSISESWVKELET